MSLVDMALLPFQLPFMQQAFLIALAAALPMGLLSPFLVLKGWSLMGDAISHAVLPGIVLAYIAGLPLALGAFGAGMICALATGYLKENSRVKEDTVMGIVFSGMFGLGIVLYTKIQTEVHLDHILFGDMLGTNWSDIAGAALIAAIAIGSVGLPPVKASQLGEQVMVAGPPPMVMTLAKAGCESSAAAATSEAATALVRKRIEQTPQNATKPGRPRLLGY